MAAHRAQRHGDGLWAARTLRAGQTGGVVLETMGGRLRRLPPEEVQRLADGTVRFWRGWLHRSSYTGRWREMVARSAMTLKLMTYAPTGAVVAAPTAGLPEQVGGERNWDYRYTWIRDGSFSIHALLGLGFIEEPAPFGGWLRDRADQWGAHQRRDQPGLPARPRRRDGRACPITGVLRAGAAVYNNGRTSRRRYPPAAARAGTPAGLLAAIPVSNQRLHVEDHRPR